MKEVSQTRTVWSLGTVAYNRLVLSEVWVGTRLDTGERISRQLEKPLPDILLAGLPKPDQSTKDWLVLIGDGLDAYELIAEPPQD